MKRIFDMDIHERFCTLIEKFAKKDHYGIVIDIELANEILLERDNSNEFDKYVYGADFWVEFQKIRPEECDISFYGHSNLIMYHNTCEGIFLNKEWKNFLDKYNMDIFTFYNNNKLQICKLLGFANKNMLGIHEMYCFLKRINLDENSVFIYSFGAWWYIIPNLLMQRYLIEIEDVTFVDREDLIRKGLIYEEKDDTNDIDIRVSEYLRNHLQSYPVSIDDETEEEYIIRIPKNVI